MNTDGLKPINITASPPLMGGAVGGTITPTMSQNSLATGANNDTKRDNPFMQFVASTRYAIV